MAYKVIKGFTDSTGNHKAGEILEYVDSSCKDLVEEIIDNKTIKEEIENKPDNKIMTLSDVKKKKN